MAFFREDGHLRVPQGYRARGMSGRSDAVCGVPDARLRFLPGDDGRMRELTSHWEHADCTGALYLTAERFPGEGGPQSAPPSPSFTLCDCYSLSRTRS